MAFSNIIFTSDTHASHANIIKYCNRPFKSVDDMNKEMSGHINRMLPNGGTVYHLGDWAFGIENSFQFMNKINRNIEVILIEGNHDKKNLRDRDFCRMFQKVAPLLELKLGNQDITLCHYAMKVWNKSHHGSWHLYGHSHNTLTDDPTTLSIDVGVDAAAARFGEYRPFTFDEIQDIMSRKTWKSIDHHGD